jgi:hypothetical protein
MRLTGAFTIEGGSDMGSGGGRIGGFLIGFGLGFISKSNFGRVMGVGSN